jgi:hypothetical protein
MKKVALSLAIVAMVAATANANLLTNGDFAGDYGSTTINGWENFAAPGQTAKAQLFAGGGAEFGLTQIPETDPDGTYQAQWLSGYGTDRNGAYIMQQFTQPANTMLDFSGELWAGARHFGQPIGDWAVGLDVLYDPEGGTDIANATWIFGEWNQNSVDGVFSQHAAQMMSGNSTTGTIFIKSIQNNGFEWNMSAADNIVVTPEPASLALLLLGLPMLRRRR